MATLLPTAQPSHYVVVNTNPADTGSLLGVLLTITDAVTLPISLIETNIGIM